MDCDMHRLRIAIEAAREEQAFMMRHDYRVAGYDVEEPVPDPETDEEFNDQFRAAMDFFKAGRKKRSMA